MKILYILPEGESMPKRRSQMMAQRNVYCDELSPTLLSAFTAVKIASAMGKADYDWIHAYNLRDAMSAVSARKIAKGQKSKILVEILPNTEIPKGIPGDLRQGVDAWAFPSQRLMDAYPQGLNRAFLLPPADFDLDWQSIVESRPSQTDIAQYAWVGSLDGNIDRLKGAIQIIDENPALRLKICGTGKARYVMEAVRKQRGMQHPEHAEWLGENFNLQEILTHAHALIQAGQDLCPVESEAIARGIPVVMPQGSVLVPSMATGNSQDQYCDTLAAQYTHRQ